MQGYAGLSYLQVLHTGADHWVTIKILSEEEVRVYDSVFLKANLSYSQADSFYCQV